MQPAVTQKSATMMPAGPRITLRQRAVDSAALRVLTRICPARCFRFDARDRVQFSPEGCVFCGTCQSVCSATGEVEWGWSGVATSAP